MLKNLVFSQFLKALSTHLEKRRIQSAHQIHDKETLNHLTLSQRGLIWFQDQALVNCGKIVLHPYVKELSLSCNHKITQALFRYIPECSHLQTLNLLGISSREILKGCEVFQFLPELKKLCLQDADSEIIYSVSLFCSSLTTLIIHHTDINDEIISYISSLKQLKTFNVEGDSIISPYGFAELLRTLPDLRNLGKCNSFGEVLTTLYSKWSLYHRYHGTTPKVLKLESVDCDGPITGKEIVNLQVYCPNLKSLKLVYNLFNRQESNESCGHLFSLAGLSNLTILGITSADFYSHSIFSILREGSRITTLELTNIDEMNLSSIIMIGSGCRHLEILSINCCHYNVETNDAKKISEIFAETEFHKDNLPFSSLKEATFILTTSTHLPLMKYPVFFARGLKELKLNQIYQPLEDSFITSMLSWNPLKYLEKFELNRGPHLSIMAANAIILACPNLRYLGKISSWGMVDKEEVLAMQGEIRNRNLDLVLI